MERMNGLDKEPRECRLCIRMTTDEYLKFKRKSRESGLYQADYIMKLIDMYDADFQITQECNKLKDKMVELQNLIDELE